MPNPASSRACSRCGAVVNLCPVRDASRQLSVLRRAVTSPLVKAARQPRQRGRLVVLAVLAIFACAAMEHIVLLVCLLLLAQSVFAAVVLGLAGGWGWLATSVGSGFSYFRCWLTDKHDLRTPRHAVTRQRIAAPGRLSQMTEWRGAPPHLEAGDLAFVFGLKLSAKRVLVVWAREVSTGRRWVSSTLVWVLVAYGLATMLGLEVLICYWHDVTELL
jgi:hypothetical protein